MASNQPEMRALLARASSELQRGRHREAEGLYCNALERDPRNAEATHFLGLCLCESGRAEDGLALMRRSIELNGGEIMYRQNLGLLLAQHGFLDEAERCLRDAIAIEPRAPLYNFLGTVLQRGGEFREAVEAYERALALDAGDSNVHVNLGYLRFEAGEIDAAIGHYRKAIELDPDNAMARNNLGNALHAQGNAPGAEAAYREAMRLAPRFALAYHNLGGLLRAEGRQDEAVACLRAAARFAPAQAASWQLLADALADARFDVRDAGLEADLAACLARDDIDPMLLGAPAFSLLLADPRFAALVRPDAEIPDGRLADWLFRDALPPLRSPLAGALLENAIVPDPRFERLAARLRRALLHMWSSGRSDAVPLELVCALAHQFHLGEYVIEEPPDETGALDELRSAIERGPAAAARPPLALYACYRSLGTLAAADRLRADAADCFGRLVLRQVAEPREEGRLREEIELLTPVDDPVSLAVRAQYEENPYPRWRSAPAGAGRYPMALRLRTLFPRLRQEELALPGEPGILIAGCGTGRHAAITAQLNPTARILAVDVSRASLAYALRRARELGLANVRFAQADLLRLTALGERFDLVECAGVLHHLREPLAGWRALSALVRPRGFMKIALYSETARRGVTAARRWLAERDFGATPRGIRAGRAALVALPEGALERTAIESPDFWSLSGCRDLLFHVQERCFTPGMIADALSELELEFLGFEFDETATLRSYRAEFPEDPEAASLRNWEAFESRHPGTFAGMYQFWVRKPGEAR